MTIIACGASRGCVAIREAGHDSARPRRQHTVQRGPNELEARKRTTIVDGGPGCPAGVDIERLDPEQTVDVLKVSAAGENVELNLRGTGRQRTHPCAVPGGDIDREQVQLVAAAI